MNKLFRFPDSEPGGNPPPQPKKPLETLKVSDVEVEEGKKKVTESDKNIKK